MKSREEQIRFLDRNIAALEDIADELPQYAETLEMFQSLRDTLGGERVTPTSSHPSPGAREVANRRKGNRQAGETHGQVAGTP